ncbi:hypothetical protein SAY87_017942 [Trapa incisa]|uniref:Phytocyanin domain-containing protein n=1 Tax=Trapa incisa TaxID=236973 RepID=A0AAN7QVT3_9MYRT|nr:hypothetical protein SAY87_017942 [Trapa incisa]
MASQSGLPFSLLIPSLSSATLFLLLLLPLQSEAYKNYTVGDSLGWYDSSVKAGVDYQKWASGKNFSLGDFLFFNTDTNHSVIQTYNLTTYSLCDYDNAMESDTIQWSSSNPSNTETQPVTVAVPLVKEGTNYFFSSDYDGDQCRDGHQRFQINVTHGQGLPKDLATDNQGAPAPLGPVSGNDDDSAPDTIVPANFDKPHNESAADVSDSPSAAGPSGGLTGTGRIMLMASCLLFLACIPHGGMS